MKLDNLKDSQYNDEQVMRILDEFWNDTAEDWYEKEKQEEKSLRLQSLRMKIVPNKKKDVRNDPQPDH